MHVRSLLISGQHQVWSWHVLTLPFPEAVPRKICRKLESWTLDVQEPRSSCMLAASLHTHGCMREIHVYASRNWWWRNNSSFWWFKPDLLVEFPFCMAFSGVLSNGFIDPRFASPHPRNPSTVNQHGPAFQDWCKHLGVCTDAGNAVGGIKAGARRLVRRGYDWSWKAGSRVIVVGVHTAVPVMSTSW